MSVNEGYKSRTARTCFKMAAAFENSQRNGVRDALQGSQLDVRQAAHYNLKYIYTDQSVFKHLKPLGFASGL